MDEKHSLIDTKYSIPINRAVSNPRSAVEWLAEKWRMRHSTINIDPFISSIAELTGAKHEKVRSIYYECVNGKAMENYEEQTLKHLRGNKREHISRKIIGPVKSARLDRIGLYVVTRIIKPDVVVETGVATGQSSLFILEALERNNNGKLYSFDIGIEVLNEKWYNAIYEADEIGWVVNESLRSRWELIIGDSVEQMKSTLPKIPPVDFFYHDSLHKYDHMYSEYDIVSDYLDDGAILMSEDIHRNQAWDDFLNERAGEFRGDHRYYSLQGIQEDREIAGTILME